MLGHSIEHTLLDTAWSDKTVMLTRCMDVRKNSVHGDWAQQFLRILSRFRLLDHIYIDVLGSACISSIHNNTGYWDHSWPTCPVIKLKVLCQDRLKSCENRISADPKDRNRLRTITIKEIFYITLVLPWLI